MRQGDPLSPLLFNLCINLLSNSINKECERGHWKPAWFNDQETKIFHMVFADDIVIVGKATLVNIQRMLKTVEDFCQASGRRTN